MSDGMIGPDTLAPDLTEPLIAFRSWRIEDGRLVGPFRCVPWARDNVAECSLSKCPKDHPAPHEDGPCGLYGYFLLREDGKFPNGAYHGSIRGAIQVVGRIALHETGLRAERAKIVCLVEDQRAISAVGGRAEFRKLASKYNVPVVEPEGLAAFAYQHGTPVPDPLLARIQAINEERRRVQREKAEAWRQQIQARAAERRRKEAEAQRKPFARFRRALGV